MKSTGIKTILFEPQWDDPFAARHRRTHAAIRVRTDEGLVGEDPRNSERLYFKMARVTREANVTRAMGVIGAVDIALWDLVGKAANLPCWQLLGGYRDWSLRPVSDHRPRKAPG